MVLTVSLNPCIDKTVSIEEFHYGGLNRIKDSRLDASGKGINVAIACRQLGAESSCVGINYTRKGELIEQRLKKWRVPYNFVQVEGEVRTNLKVWDQKNGILTEFNESGPPVPSRSIECLNALVRNYAKRSSIVVFSGSVPKGISNYIYAKLLGELEGLPVKTILDAEGQLLLNGLQAHPFMIKPNLYELEKALGTSLKSHKDIIRAGRRLLDQGVTLVCVSMGEKGALFMDRHEAYFAPALEVPVKSTAGAGDSMVAGCCLALENNMGIGDMIRYGTAAAASSVMSEGTSLCSRKEFDMLLEKVQPEKLNI